MKTHLEFRSNAFPPYPEEEEQINPGLYGKRLADFLVGPLRAAGFQVDDPGPEDWGWRITLTNPEFPLWVGCGHYEEWVDGFLVFIQPSKPVVRRWFRKVRTEAVVTKVAEAIESALLANPEVRSFRWWSEGEVGNGGA